jgi:hypothetical protein
LTVGWDPLPGLIALALYFGWVAQRRFRRVPLIELLGSIEPEDPLLERP